MAFIRKNLWWVGLLAIGAVYYFYFYKQPCEAPITYSIGTIDERFGVSKTEVLSSINSAAILWEKSIDRDLFKYDTKGKLIVNFVYDTRQKTTQQNEILKADVEKTSQLANSVKQEYKDLNADLEVSKRLYDDELATFNAKQKMYGDKVSYWNARGGAPPDTYNQLEAERQALIVEQRTLEAKRLAVNETADKVNTFIQKYNLLVQSANERIDTINQTAGQEFQEGAYDPNTNTITIYEFSTQEKLNRVLAHELGHALGLDHNSNPNSIMYGLNQSNTFSLSKDDVSALKALCKVK